MRLITKTTTRRAIVAIAAFSLVAAACGDDDSSSDTTSAGSGTTTPSSGSAIGGTVECDASSLAAGLNEPESSIENFDCTQGWAGVTYTDSSGEGQSAVLEAEGQFWILKDASACEGDPPALPSELSAYCPS
ncbi:MAG: hypothetical protein AAFY28_09385 [Actinomycetota bacterium]